MSLIEDASLKDKRWVFADRKKAGAVLARMLEGRVSDSGIIMAIPSGGMPVARVIADTLGMEMGVVVVRRIQIPWNTETGFGAVGPNGEPVFNSQLLARLRLSEEDILRQRERAMRSVRQREKMFLKGRPYPSVKGREVVLVDDGLATGYTMLAAVRFTKGRGARTVSVAVPTASVNAIELLEDTVDHIYCANLRTGSAFAVADAYDHWTDISEWEVERMLDAR